MSEGPLSILNTSKASTAVPLIADGQMIRFKVQSVTLDGPEGNRLWPQIKADVRTCDPAPSSDGHPINPGFPIFITFPLGTKDDPTKPADWVAGAVSKFMDGILGTGDVGNKKGKPERPDIDPSMFPDFIGKEFFAKVGIKQSKDEAYGPQNVLKTYTFIGDVAS